MKKSIIFLFTILGMTTTAAADTGSDNLCRTKRFRCEAQCSANNKVGSAEHLKCNDQCRDDESFCRKIGFSPR